MIVNRKLLWVVTAIGLAIPTLVGISAALGAVYSGRGQQINAQGVVAAYRPEDRATVSSDPDGGSKGGNYYRLDVLTADSSVNIASLTTTSYPYVGTSTYTTVGIHCWTSSSSAVITLIPVYFKKDPLGSFFPYVGNDVVCTASAIGTTNGTYYSTGISYVDTDNALGMKFLVKTISTGTVRYVFVSVN